MSLLFGDKFQLGLCRGGTYFIGAQYEWRSRDDLNGGRITTGTAQLNAVAVRLAPELSFAVADGCRFAYSRNRLIWIA